MEVVYVCIYNIFQKDHQHIDKERKNNSANTDIITVKSKVKEILWQRFVRVSRHAERLLPNLKG